MKENSTISNFRDSNMELARIVAMSMIVIWHFIVHGLWGTDRFTTFSTSGSLHFDQYVQWIAASFLVVGVNLFVLISGYYRIRLRWRSLIGYYFMCVFYSLMILFVSSGIANVGLPEIGKAFLVSYTPNWFFPAYFILMLISPLLNLAIESMNLEQLRISVLILLLLTCFTGWLLQNGNDNGYNAYQLFTVYFIGGYLSREKVFERLGNGWYLALYCAVCLMNFASMIVLYYLLDKDILAMFNYNCIFVVIASVFLFLFFRGIKIRSKCVNVIASTVVAALFVQEAVSARLYAFIHGSYMSDGFSYHLLLWLVVFFFAIFLFAFGLESLRKLLMNPLVKRLSSWLDSFIPFPFESR